ncbi:antiviral reverse transcriptase Drt2 [Paracoccus tibetensis]|uniref:Reverse transcriptase (RNA-dependent DNA polymerase) n=1 Tax=Paracoccus tibetensis TaxID=336292 RepID=A0A1G5DHM5_9RHOB|nr:antiviral reverse transcriptase Drt2 [Paracoccus tibetensis]SCY14064.1 Reverse transcriptase (RNA-dependent DNA polymerase) [Paracoccus tibetensis]
MPGFYLPTHDEYDPSQDDFVAPFVTKERKYRHFDLPLSEKDRQRTYDFTSEATRHRFYPLLGFTDTTWKVTRNAAKDVVKKKKERPIRYSAHADAAYLQAYAEHLNEVYEQALSSDQTTASVLAYRRSGGSNIHHARSLFAEIAERGDCQVICMDISGFFDMLDHSHLKDELLSLRGAGRLLGHDWTVYQFMTRYAWVETSDIEAVLGKDRKRQGRICSPDDFREHVRGRSDGLVRMHELSYGIPQGTPLSGLYANIYMRTFDRQLLELARSLGGSYRRYSDDIAVVLPRGIKRRHVVAVVEKALADYHLPLSVEKTEAAEFHQGLLVGSRPIQYLGFTYDGQRTLIRPSSIDAYCRKMRRGIHAKLVAAKSRGIPSFSVYKRDLMSRYTHKGKGRNFIRYAYRSSDLMGTEAIRHQVRNHLRWFNNAWEREVEAVYGGLVSSK